VINTHAHAENVLGNAAFADEIAAGMVTVWATLGTRQGMEQRCPACLESLTARVGADAMADTRIVWPTTTLFEEDTLVLGPHQLQVLRVEQGHTDADLVLWLPEAGVLWAGGLVYDGRLPEFAQGTLDAWLAALQRLAALTPRAVVGSRAGGPGMLAATQEYLTTLRRRVLAGMDAGRVAGETGLVPMPEWSHWAGHERQEFNTQRAWRELEPVWMGVPGK
jgi:glyoxylase-like metal-dependent hydrolase (beta-lactamase superfamily II)